ncbi:MAG: hypothetical protein LBV37_01725 [Mycoplasmataceae bacterium]|jgi:hypothetical protein|nr:hypothetical protein [Mycoplasmataceae bacterium]
MDKTIGLITKIADLFIKNHWNEQDLTKFMSMAGIKDQATRDYIFAGVCLKIAMMEAR